MKLLKKHFSLSYEKISEKTYYYFYVNVKKSIEEARDIDYVLTRHGDFHKVLLSSLLNDSTYIGIDNLKQYIVNKTVGYYKVTFKLNHRDITIYFVIFDKSDFNLNFNFYSFLMMSYLIFCGKINKTCSESLTTYIYLTPFEKILNNGDKIIGTKNVNSGVTFSCKKNNEICIYRKEEFMKVFFHEILHSYGLDNSKQFTTPNFIKHMRFIFSISTTDNYFEAYTEFMALHLLVFFISIQINTTFKNSYDCVNLFLENELYFSMYQMNKVLEHNGISYEDLIFKRNTHLYKEKSNVFSYYVLKTIMLYFNNRIFETDKYNLYKVLGILAKNKTFIKETKQFEKKKINKYLEKTMRMTIFPEF